jgi:hypothetical protein
MLNIFADALMVALGQLPKTARRPGPEFTDREGLRTAEMLRNLGR